MGARRSGWSWAAAVLALLGGLALGGRPAAADVGGLALGGRPGEVGGPPAAAQPWAWPLEGASRSSVTRVFAPPDTRYGSGHRGVDLAGAPGVPVRAAGAGRVAYAGLLAGRGVLVVVHDGGLRTTYEPVTATVGVGALVAAGDAVGVLEAGHAGCPAAACLHWGLRRGEEYLDPLSLVGAGPVRLLPLDGSTVGGLPAGWLRAAMDQPVAGPAEPPVAGPAEPAAAAGPGGAAAAAPEAGPVTALRSAAAPVGGALLVALLALLALRPPRRPPSGPAGGVAALPRPSAGGEVVRLDDRRQAAPGPEVRRAA